MIIEHRIYTIQVGKVSAFCEYYKDHGLEVQKKILGNLVGYFTSDIGKLNQVLQMWGYESYAERERRRAELSIHSDWLAYLKGAPPVVIDQETRVFLPTHFSPLK